MSSTRWRCSIDSMRCSASRSSPALSKFISAAAAAISSRMRAAALRVCPPRTSTISAIMAPYSSCDWRPTHGAMHSPIAWSRQGRSTLELGRSCRHERTVYSFFTSSSDCRIRRTSVYGPK